MTKNESTTIDGVEYAVRVRWAPIAGVYTFNCVRAGDTYREAMGGQVHLNGKMWYAFDSTHGHGSSDTYPAAELCAAVRELLVEQCD